MACHRGIRHHLGDYLSEEDEIEEIPFIGIFRYLGRLLIEKCGETKLFTVPKIPVINDKPVPVSQLEALCFLPGSVFGLLYFFKKNWMMNNLFGCTFSIFGIENMMLGQYKIGVLLLTLLFFYDVFFVFFTPVMVGVAKNLDGPIKLMFPKVVNYSQPSDFNSNSKNKIKSYY